MATKKVSFVYHETWKHSSKSNLDKVILRNDKEDEVSQKGEEGMSEILFSISRPKFEYPDIEEDNSSDCDDYDTDLEEKTKPKELDSITQNNRTQDIYRQACIDKDIVPASIFFSQCNTTSVDLKHYGLGNKGARAVALALKNNQTVQNLNLHDNGITEKGTCDICEMTKVNMWLNKLDLSGNAVGKTGVKALADMIPQAVMLKELNLSSCKIHSKNVQKFISALATNHRLEMLDLSYNEIGDEGATCFEEVLARNHTITCLDLSCNGISFLGVEQFCNGLSQNATVAELNMSWNGLANHGALCMSRVLVQNHSLKVLDLRHNHITLSGIERIAKSLQRNVTLQVLKIGKNPFLAAGTRLLLKSLAKNPETLLRELTLDGIVFNTECNDDLSIVMTQHPTFVCKWDGSIKGGSVLSGVQPLPMDLLLQCIYDQGFRLLDFYRYLTNDNVAGLLTKENFISGIKKRNFPFS